MTLNDLEWLFCVIICFGRLRLSEKTVRKFAELTTYTVSDKNVAQGTYFLKYKAYADIRGGSLERGRQMIMWSLKMAIFASFVHCLPNITYMATRQLSLDASVDDLGVISRLLYSFTSNFSKTMRDTAKVTIDY